MKVTLTVALRGPRFGCGLAQCGACKEIAAYLKTGAVKGNRTAFGPMAEVVQNSLSYLTDADLRAQAQPAGPNP
jgi:hypothetical protein